MANGFILRPLRPFAVSSDSVAPAFPVSNVIDPQPKVVWQTQTGAGTWTVRLTIDLGADEAIDTVALLFHSGVGAGFASAYGRTAAQGPWPQPNTGEVAGEVIVFEKSWTEPAAGRPARRHVLFTMPAAATYRYVRLVVFVPGTANPDWRAGVLAVGRRWQPGFNFEHGSGRLVRDLSSMEVLPGGEHVGARAAKVPIWRCTFGDLTDAELRSIWTVLQDVGESEPVLVVEDPDPGVPGLHERIHYGRFQGLSFYERTQADKSTIEVQLVNWL